MWCVVWTPVSLLPVVYACNAMHQRQLNNRTVVYMLVQGHPNGSHVIGPVRLFYNLYFYFLIETMFFSHNKSVGTMFQLVFSAKRTGALSIHRSRVHVYSAAIEHTSVSRIRGL